MPPWPLSAPRRGAIFAQLICPRRFFVPARLLFFCFYSWPLGGEPYSLGFFCHGRILIPARFFVISHWPALGGEPHSPGLFRHGRILIPARFFVTSHWPALGGRPYSPDLFCHGRILIPVRFFCHIPLAPRRAALFARFILPRRDSHSRPLLLSHPTGRPSAGASFARFILQRWDSRSRPAHFHSCPENNSFTPARQEPGRQRQLSFRAPPG